MLCISQVKNKAWFKALDGFDHVCKNWTIDEEKAEAVLHYTGRLVPGNPDEADDGDDGGDGGDDVP